MQNLPIDIHSNKLLDWLISRRHCPKNWQKAVEEIRHKISNAMRDMPENEQIVRMLDDGQYIYYFHCNKILEILHETEKDTKNMFGFYSSQRIKDWKEIISLYHSENVYLAEAANFLQRFVQYEVPALRRQIAKAEATAREFERKEEEYQKQGAESRRAFARELAKWGIGGEGGGAGQGQEQHGRRTDLRTELLAMADAMPQADLTFLAELGPALAYFNKFSEFVEQKTDDMFPLMRLLDGTRPANEITVFEWRHGRKPDIVIPPAKFRISQSAEEQKSEEDEIDFGDDGPEEGADEADIDFCTNGDDTAGIQIVSMDGEGASNDQSPTFEPASTDNVAGGEEALPVLEHPLGRATLLDELDQLCGFLQFRLDDELADSAAASLHLSAQMAQNPPPPVGLDQIRAWLGAFRRALDQLGNPQQLQMLRLRTSQRFVDEVVAQLEHKRRLEFKYQQLERLAAEKQVKCAEECKKWQQLLEKIIEAAKGLQENLEADISRRYNGREVYIMGEINAVLYQNN